MVTLTFNETVYDFKYNYNTEELVVFKNNKEVYRYSYNPLIVNHLSMRRCSEILIENNL